MNLWNLKKYTIVLGTPLKMLTKSTDIYQCLKSVQIKSFSGLHFPVLSPNNGKYGPEKTPYLGTFHAVYTFKAFTKKQTDKRTKVRITSNKEKTVDVEVTDSSTILT